MSNQAVNIVWLKRDLRSQDHNPLLEAERDAIPYRIIYIFEPSLIEYPDTSPRHIQFVYHSIIALNKTLKPFNRSVEVFYAEALEIFNYLSECFNINNLYSYCESGTQNTWQRDKKIKVFCTHNQINWQEFQRDGILRGIKNRVNWNKQWHITMHKPVIQNVYSSFKQVPLNHSFLIPDKLEAQLKNYPKQFQPPGELYAWRYLKSFAKDRGFNYQKHISKPSESRT